ncbi:putative bifunctional diguanylate cyclase/phosphodiesterase [Thiohalorhabdus sp.]|uniref:putative bifunctional diguanylate cyclase/phosphodiesterase n=1 Tax=Thiohalorhabdus sp. TaxID=3094134 RepID=UPI002FC3CE11
MAPDPVARSLREGHIVGLGNHTALLSKSGREYVIEDSAASIRLGNSPAYGAVLVFRDVTGERLARQKLEYLGHNDNLTGLHNRHFFEQELERVVHRANRGGGPFAMVYLDLDQFKLVNDTAGHGAGDELLVQIGGILARRVRREDVLARLGGDEFGVLVYDVGQAGAMRVAEDLLKGLQDFRFHGEERTYDVGGSAGVALIDEHTGSAAEVMRNADIACYLAKREKPGCCHLFSAEDESAIATVGEMRLVNEITEALEANRFSFNYQPIVRATDGGVVHYEIMLRLLDRHGDPVPPAEFIAAAERYGLMVQVDRWGIDHALAELGGWLQGGWDLTLTINLSGTSIGDPDILTRIQEALQAHRIPEGRVIFEVTETAAVARIEKAGAFMRQLRHSGCRFALDDFGTGFSSFDYLKYLPVDYLKIDGTFIGDLATDPVDKAMVASISQIAESLGMQTVAEFVESPEVFALLESYEVDLAQGFHISRPIPSLGNSPL